MLGKSSEWRIFQQAMWWVFLWMVAT
jgi:hypothetical protein